MKTIANNIDNEIIIKNSKFITNIFKINNFNEINNYLELIKNKYKDATHNPYAYIYEDKKKSADDGEPSNTSGLPILQVLEKKELSNILVVVTRYFGGIKLGAGGLVRAYTKSVTNALEKANYINLDKGININIIFNYDNIKNIDYLLKDITILNKEFNDNIIYNVNISYELLNKLKELKNIKIDIIKEVYIEKRRN